MTTGPHDTTRRRLTRLAMAAIVAIAAGTMPAAAGKQIKLIPNKGLNMMAVFTNCISVKEQATGYYSVPMMNQYEWPKPIVVFAPNPGRMDLMTNTQPDWANMFSSNPALLRVPTSVQLRTGGTWNEVTRSSYELTDIATQPTAVKVTGRSTINSGDSISFNVVVYPRYHIQSVQIENPKNLYVNQDRLTVLLRLPWALPSYASAVKAVFSRPTLTWDGQTHQMDAAAWGGQQTVVVNQDQGRRDIRLPFQIKVTTPPSSTPAKRILWRRQREITFTMDVEIQGLSSSCRLVKDPTKRTVTFKVRNPDYAAPLADGSRSK